MLSKAEFLAALRLGAPADGPHDIDPGLKADALYEREFGEPRSVSKKERKRLDALERGTKAERASGAAAPGASIGGGGL